MTGFRWNYLRDWVKVARELPRTRGAYPDGPIVALVFAFCKAAEQPEPGTFDSVPILRAILDATGNKRGRWVQFLIEHGDVVVGADGRATLPNWRSFQEEGTSTERVRKHRANKRGNGRGNGIGNADETLHATDEEPYAGAPPRRDEVSRLRRTSHDVGASDDARALAGENGARRDEPVWQTILALEEIAGPFGFTAGSAAFEKLSGDVAAFGADRVIAEYRSLRAELNGSPVVPEQIVFGAHKRLFPIPDAPRQSKPAVAPKGMVQDVADIRRQLDAR